MPNYEVTLITRSLSKADLFTTLKRAATTLLNNGAVIEDFQSLGHRDLPYRRYSKSTNEQVYASNFFLINSCMPLKTMHTVKDIMVNDKDLLHFYAMNKSLMEQEEFECNLPELLKPPAYRKSVEDLRLNQRLNHKNKKHYMTRAKIEWKAVPKSYHIAPARD